MVLTRLKACARGRGFTKGFNALRNRMTGPISGPITGPITDPITGTVVFDLDGTLADTSGDLLAAANACFQALGHGALLDARDTLTAFQGGRAMLRLGFSRLGQVDEAEVDRHHPILLRAYGSAIDTHTRLYQGAVEAVQDLRRAGYVTTICTNKPKGLADILLDRLGIRDLFATVIGADSLPTRKPDPAPYLAAVLGGGGDVARSLLVGDTETDLRTARAAGVPVVLVAFGPEGRGIERLGPDAMLNHFDDLGAVVARLLPVCGLSAN